VNLESDNICVNVSSHPVVSDGRDARQLTPESTAVNASEPLCQYCGRAIPAHRAAYARRSKQPALWCRATCRVRACIARKRARATEPELR